MSKKAFIFPGQGSQYVGMGKELYENMDICRDVFNIANEKLGFKISELCFEGPIDELNITENTQPAILTVNIACLKALEYYGIKADITAGLSLGEYSALICSGVMRFEDTINLVKKRGKFMQEAVPIGIGGMSAVLGLKEDILKEICNEVSNEGILEIANLNCPGQIVMAGEIKALEKASELCKEKGAKKVVKLPLSAPFHTSMLKSAAEKLSLELDKMNFTPMKIPVITNVTGDYIDEYENIKEILKLQVMSSVRWEDTIRTMIRDGVDTFIEVGPGKALSGFVKKIDRNLKVLNVENMTSLENAVRELKS
ncbi:MAG: ACP S-malonyltransferase [Clostridium argentinense]|uniref:Malonyl CoA-acyl carrier protein transacylase n=1 Tax=Clostridium faecium TaxID=2762223 RepID=A0ABR8YSM8_9CLOT|nr:MULTISPECIES: ACP S-malonyltransferase [Clostridium]MBD8047251.1 ACP S-malonyltransferase [Clostridium faecium]MBS5824375.1 ACP S-malonyltransferase [Clostridium argentinense]MDU1349229.1 ACP S-malonyltransferase [Clostridium argentinense]